MADRMGDRRMNNNLGFIRDMRNRIPTNVDDVINSVDINTITDEKGIETEKLRLSGLIKQYNNDEKVIEKIRGRVNILNAKSENLTKQASSSPSPGFFSFSGFRSLIGMGGKRRRTNKKKSRRSRRKSRRMRGGDDDDIYYDAYSHDTAVPVALLTNISLKDLKQGKSYKVSGPNGAILGQLGVVFDTKIQTDELRFEKSKETPLEYYRDKNITFDEIDDNVVGSPNRYSLKDFKRVENFDEYLQKVVNPQSTKTSFLSILNPFGKGGNKKRTSKKKSRRTRRR